MRLKHSSRRRSSTMLAAAVSLAGLGNWADAVNRTWIVFTGDWSQPANWSGLLVPVNNDQAIIVHSDTLGARTVNYNYTGVPVTLTGLQLSGGSNILSAAANLNQSGNTLLVNNVQIGINGTGVFNQSGGFTQLAVGSFTTNGMFLGTTPTGKGTYNFSGGNFNAGTTSNGNARIVVGQQGAGTFNLTGGLAFTNAITVGEGSLATGTLILTGAGDLRFNNAGLVTIGDRGAGTFIHNGGSTLQIEDLTIGAQAGGTGVYRLEAGNLNISTSNQFTDASLFLGSAGNGTFIHTGGQVSFSGPRVGSSGLSIGFNGGAGTYLLSGTGQLSGFNQDIRMDRGAFIQTGGTIDTPRMSVGGAGDGLYTISSGSVARFSDALTVQSGTIAQSGGSLSVGNFEPLLGEPSLGQLGVFGRFELSGGTLDVSGAMIVASLTGGTGSGIFNQTGGVHKVQGIGFIGDLRGLAPGAVGTYLLSGGRLEVTPVSIQTDTLTDNSLEGLRLDTGGTIVGGAADGVFAGRMTQVGGTIAGIFRNDGTVVSRGGLISGTFLNRRTLTMDGGTTVASLTISNNAGALINGAGSIAGGVTNFGRIAPTGALSINTISNATGSEVFIGPGTSLRSTFIDNSSHVRLEGGSLLGVAGQIQTNANTANGGGLVSGGGLIEPLLVMNGGTVRADLPGLPLTIRAVSLTDPSSKFQVAPNSVMNFQSNFTNTVEISLQGGGAKLVGATVSNSATIRGAGEITNQVVNSGVVRSEGGVLTLSSPNNANLPPGQIQVGSGTVRFPASLQVNNGQISLSGGEFDNGAGSISSTGTIVGRGVIRSGTITNTGTMTFSGGVSDVFAPVVNNNRLNITGSADVSFYQPVNTAGGTINVNLGSSAVFFGTVTGVSRITGAGVKDFEGAASDGAIDTPGGTTIVGPDGNLSVNFIRDGVVSIVGRASINPNGTNMGTSRVNELLVDGVTDNWVGRLDLRNNAMVIDYTGPTPLARIRNQLKSGRAAGAWNGNGIISSQAATQFGGAIGYAEATEIGSPATFFGQPADGTSLLMRYTLAGDANLNGTVDIDDFGRVAANFNQPGTWFRGDFNYDGTVSIDDFGLLGAQFNRILPAAAARPTAVPEPTAVCLAATAWIATGLIRPRRRRTGSQTVN